MSIATYGETGISTYREGDFRVLDTDRFLHEVDAECLYVILTAAPN
jgi:hypothetical protein